MSFLFSKNKKQLEVIFDWLSGIVSQNDLILLEREGKQEGYYFKFPLKFGDKPEKLKCVNDKDFSFFIKFSSRQLDIDKKEWKSIFQSPELGIYESKKRFEGKQFKPLRWGLNEEEKKTALKIARESIGIFLEEKQTPQIKNFNFPLAAVFNLRADLGIALWVNGVLRGSAVVESTILSEGIIQASIYASRDSRFKPLEIKELPLVRIEITIFSNLRVPLSENLIKKNEILYNKGYLLKKGEKQGWFLPEVFNVKRFRGLNDFLENLASEKADLPPKSWNKAEIEIFDVEDFIESTDKGKFLDLYGPTVMPKSDADENNLRKRLELAADWLLNIQENNGNFPPIINPLTGWNAQIDWPRSAFSAWALAEFALLTKEKKYQDAAEKHFEFITKYIDEPGFKVQLLTLAYIGQEALTLFKMKGSRKYYLTAVKMAERILGAGDKISFDNITFQQIASFFAELTKWENHFLGPAQKFADVAKADFENNSGKNIPQNLAVQAELVNAFDKIFQLTKDSRYKEFSYRVAEWLTQYQFSWGPQGNWGPFAESTNSDFVYTRGTGKIFEVLAGLSEFRDAAKKTLVWLLTMQYNDDNTFFVPKEIRPRIIGALRHDYFNQEAWIDSAGHFLLGGARFIKVK